MTSPGDKAGSAFGTLDGGGTFPRGLCSQGPNLLLETETIFNPSFSDSAGQLFQGNM